jgi:hypothetical protein
MGYCNHSYDKIVNIVRAVVTMVTIEEDFITMVTIL